MNLIAQKYSLRSDWSAGSAENTLIVKIPAGATIKVGPEVGKMKTRVVDKQFYFIASRVYRNTIDPEDVKALGVRSNLAEGYTPIDCSLFASRLATYHGIKFPYWIAIDSTTSSNLVSNEINQSSIERVITVLLANAIGKEKKPKDKEVRIKNSLFVLTGKAKDTRGDLTIKIRHKGGYVNTSVSSGVNYLVTNDVNSTSAKARAAASYGIEVITYDELYKFL